MSQYLVPSLFLMLAAIPAAESITVVAPPLNPWPNPHPGRPAADPAAVLRGSPGVAAIRMGGIGLDPVIHGQSASRILVLADGACPHGGCPNRMDPPTSYAPAGAELLEVQMGGLSVREPGAPMGIVSLDRLPAVFTGDRWSACEADARYAGNGQAREMGAAASVGRSWGYAQGRFHVARSEDYQDGDGQDVRSAYRSSKGGGSLGWTPDATTRIEIGHDITRERDVLYAGAGMDAPRSDDRTTRMRASTRGPGSLISASLDAYLSRVEHLMDNYSLRTVTGMRMQAPTTSDTRGIRFASTWKTLVGEIGLGGDVEDLRQDARRFSGLATGPVETLNSVLWPDAHIRRLGVWSDWSLPAGETTRIIPGLRYDQVSSTAADTAVDPPGGPLSPDALYALYYGGESGTRTEHLAGASLRVEHDWRRSRRMTVSFSRQQRAADTTERFIASNATKPSDRWVGNPDLEAETHWQAQIRIEDRQVDGQGWRAEAWIDRVQDYILRDRARGQDGILRTDQATVYHNGQAMLAGAGGSLTTPLTGWLSLQGNADWTFGQDLDEDVPLGQIPPLSGSTGIKAHRERISSILTLRWAAMATRVSDDPTTGANLDIGQTPAWGVLDWSFSWQPHASTEISLGVDNLLNQTYAEHLNKPSLFDTTAERVNEPGRSLWASAAVTF